MQTQTNERATQLRTQTSDHERAELQRLIDHLTNERRADRSRIEDLERLLEQQADELNRYRRLNRTH